GPWRRRIALGLVFLGASVVVFAPLGLFFIQQPQWFVGRAALASANTRALGWPAYAANVFKTLLALNIRGDANPRHNLSLRPIFDPISSAWMLVGLLSIMRSRPGNIGR